MQRKVGRLSAYLTEVISSWPGIESVVLGEAAEEKTLDPYFTITLDIYNSDSLPTEDQRKKLFGNTTAFDTVPAFTEDRFLMEELPVKIRYQQTGGVDNMLERIEKRQWIFHDAGTYPFYRLLNGQVLYKRSDWLDEKRRALSQMPEHFWQTIVNGARLSSAYYLNDLRASVYRGDDLFTIFSLSALLRCVCSFLFALNRTFEPSARLLAERVKELPRLPDGFSGRFESLLRQTAEMSPERKREIAELLVKSIFPMA